MFKFVALFACISIALAAPGLIAEHQHTVVEEPVLAKVGSVVHTAPSAVSHQSFTRVHNNAVVAPVVAPVVKTTTIHAAPVVTTSVVEPVVPVHHAPVVHSVHAAAPLVKTVEHVVPVVKTPVVHVAPAVVKTVDHVVPVASHAVAHQSHVQLHSNAAVVAPVVHTASPIVHTVPVVHAAPAVHVVHH